MVGRKPDARGGGGTTVWGTAGTGGGDLAGACDSDKKRLCSHVKVQPQPPTLSNTHWQEAEALTVKAARTHCSL
jgi:hypothetical protein